MRRTLSLVTIAFLGITSSNLGAQRPPAIRFGTGGGGAGAVPEPKDVFGFAPGDDYKLASHEQLLDYCLLYTSPSPRDGLLSRMPSSA